MLLCNILIANLLKFDICKFVKLSTIKIVLSTNKSCWILPSLLSTSAKKSRESLVVWKGQFFKAEVFPFSLWSNLGNVGQIMLLWLHSTFAYIATSIQNVLMNTSSSSTQGLLYKCSFRIFLLMLASVL